MPRAGEAEGGEMAKIRHIVFHSADVERLAKFYVDVMGLKIVHRAKNGGISLTDGCINLSIHTNKIDGMPSGFNHFEFLVEDNQEIVERFQAHGYRAPLKRPGDRHYAEFRAIDPDGNNFDISENGYEEVRPESAKAEAGWALLARQRSGKDCLSAAPERAGERSWAQCD
jgi:catechol 2,3-dioxygenase-like lactoylglutathione lyase family enzyme